MRNIVAYFIKYPVAVNVLMMAVFLFGIMGLSKTKSSFFPQTPATFINISVVYPGASPAEIEEGVVLKIEDNLKGLLGVKRITSNSYENNGRISVEIIKGFDIDVVLADVKNAVSQVPSFPTDMEPPVVSKLVPTDNAITFIVSGDGVPLKTLKEIARNVETDMRAIKGISQVTLSGFPDEEIEIAVREQDLRAFDLTFDEVARAVANSNILTTGGNIKTETEEYLIRANNRSYYGDELDYIVVRASQSGNIIRLKDVANVKDTWSENPDRIYFNGKPAVQLEIKTTNSEDLLGAVEKTNSYIEKFNATRDNVQLSVSRDSSIALNDRTNLLVENGIFGIILVLLLLSIFLKPSIAFWVAVGLPFSFLGLFMFAPSFMTINVISLFGLILVIGILVDDAIVIGENIFNHYEQGKTPIRAAIDGTIEVIPPIIAAILTTIVAFSTFYFLPGPIGVYFGAIARVVSIVLLISLIEALIILPAHIAHSRALKKESKPFLINRWADKMMNWIRDRLYSPVLRFVLNYKIFGLAIPIGLFMLTIGAFQGGLIKFTFFPSIASNQVIVNLAMPQGTNVNITDSIATIIDEASWVINEEFTKRQSGNINVIENTIKKIGPGTANATITLNLLPGERRDFPSEDITNALREKVGPIYGVESLIYSAGNIFGGKPVSISLQGSNIESLKSVKSELKTILQAMPNLKDVSDNDPAGIKEIKLQLKDNAYLLGLSLNQVMVQVRSGFFGQSVQRFQRGRDEIRVWVRYDNKDRNSIKQLDDMWIVTSNRERVPLSEIATYTIERGDVSINHLEGQREILVDANLKSIKDSAPDILNNIRDSIMPDILAKYPSVVANFEGQNQLATEIQEAGSAVMPIILFLIYAIIAFAFRSYFQPVLLFIMIPFSMIGVAWGHWLHGQPVNMLSILGIVALIGILVNDGLVLIGKFNGLLKSGLPFDEALFEAGRARFRPIFLTSITTIAGLAPLIFERSLSAQFLIPMAIAVAYGIFIATFLTLFVLPILLDIMNWIKVGVNWFWEGKRPSRESMERAVKELESEAEAVQELGI